MKETYIVKRPRNIFMADPWYLEKFDGEKLNSLIVDFIVPENLNTACVTIEEDCDDEMPELKNLSMTIYLSPKETMVTYLSGMKHVSQEIIDRPIGVDTAKYILRIDGKSDVIYTASDGVWANYREYTRNVGNYRLTEAVVLDIGFPCESYSFDRLKEIINYFFQDVRQIENISHPVIEPQDINLYMGGI